MTALSARQLNRATLARQMLLHREPLSVVDAVRRVAAIQAQEAASPYLALWNRLDPFDPADLDSAFAERTVVKASLVRITLHAVHAEDYPFFHDAMVDRLRGSRLHDDRFKTSGLSIPEVDDFLPELLTFLAQPRSRVEIEAEIEALFGEAKPQAWWALRTFAPLHHAPTGGPWSFGTRQTFIAAAAVPPASPDESVQRLFLRYLSAFGPASAADFAQFTMLLRPVIKRTIDALGGRIQALDGPDETVLFDLLGAPLPDEDTPAPPRLMAMWDSILLAYADRSRVIPPDYRREIIRSNGDVLPTILVDGHVAGVWRPVEGGIEVTAFHRLPDDAWRGLEMEAVRLVAFLADRDPTVYRRYNRWWTALTGAEVRVLPG